MRIGIKTSAAAEAAEAKPTAAQRVRRMKEPRVAAAASMDASLP
jgi:hypothetical protein